MNKQAYSYSVLRYIHDLTTGEFVNVGLALYCPEMQYANSICRTTSKRLTPLFPSMDTGAFRASMRMVQTRFNTLHDEIRNQLELRSFKSVMELAQSVIPRDDSSLQWSPMGSGLTSNPGATLEFLFERFVTKHEENSTVYRRNDDQVWKNFSRELEQQQVLKHFQPQTFTTTDDEIKFDRAWKNGVWHCLAPVSFDLASADSIKDKAHKWLGQITSMNSADLKLYFLVGEPSQPDLKPVYQSALKILKKSSNSAEIFTETDAASLSLRLAKQVAAHEAKVTQG
jgi:hypothetical protein